MVVDNRQNQQTNSLLPPAISLDIVGHSRGRNTGVPAEEPPTGTNDTVSAVLPHHCRGRVDAEFGGADSALQPGVLLFEPSHKDRVIDAVKAHSKAHKGKGVSRRRPSRANAPGRTHGVRTGLFE